MFDTTQFDFVVFKLFFQEGILSPELGPFSLKGFELSFEFSVLIGEADASFEQLNIGVFVVLEILVDLIDIGIGENLVEVNPSAFGFGEVEVFLV